MFLIVHRLDFFSIVRNSLSVSIMPGYIRLMLWFMMIGVRSFGVCLIVTEFTISSFVFLFKRIVFLFCLNFVLCYSINKSMNKINKIVNEWMNIKYHCVFYIFIFDWFYDFIFQLIFYLFYYCLFLLFQFYYSKLICSKLVR